MATPELGSYPPPSIPVQPAERISSSLALCHTFDLASALSSGSIFGWSLFFATAGGCPGG
ncbi:hypothetical protein VW29_01440 [Devosia limi DSM 17137]|uniref:Uncharacterized protein n=1 Tax=Devosia limi DSM 17137 TaxID=1121477 RepID=A0A0F5LWA8_9HYPH|nr:hypothetical protein VW29_01440 [Devosia limi DSM 17137]